jgi:glycosyltransferase involved in cell wall biosynthesis
MDGLVKTDSIAVSIIVPVYNVKEEYLHKCLESILAQTLPNIEIIIIDDGSTDNSFRICEEYAGRDSRIVLISQSNSGVSVARNKGIKAARGKWITFVDADDWIEAAMCELMVKQAEEWDSQILIIPPLVHKEAETFENPFFAGDIKSCDLIIREELQIRTMVLSYPKATFRAKAILTGHTFGKLILREFLIESRVMFQDDLLLQQDGIFYLKLFEKCSRISYLNRFLYHYRLYQTSSHMKSRRNVERIYSLVQQAFLDFIKKNNKSSDFYDAYYAKCVSDISIIVKNEYFNPDKALSLGSRLKGLSQLLKQEPYYTAIKKCNKVYLTKLKRRNLFYYRYRMLFLMWIDWKLYDYKHSKGRKAKV